MIREFFEKHFNKRVFKEKTVKVKLDAKTLGVLYRHILAEIENATFAESVEQHELEVMCSDLIWDLDQLLTQQQQEYLEINYLSS